MSSILVGFGGIIAAVLLVAVRVPIGLALSLSSFLGIWLLFGQRTAVGAVKSLPYDFTAHWSLSAIPMFLLMGTVIHQSGLTQSLFTAARLWFSFMPGGLAVATNFACAGFATASGSSIATATAMGRIAIPEMLRYRYDKGLAGGVVACGGTLGSLIPPSILFVLYGTFAQESISALLIAGIIPGLLTALIYMIMIVVRCWLRPELGPPVSERVSWSERFRSLLGIWPLPILIIGVIGGLYSGVFTATETGAAGAVFAIIIAVFFGDMRLAGFYRALVDAVISTAAIFFVAVGAILLTRFLALSGIPAFLADTVSYYAASELSLLLIMSVIFVFLGMFLDPIGMMLITLPFLLPLIEHFDMNGIWMGVIVVKFVEISLITPPVGMNTYAVKSVVGDAISLDQIFRGCGWFLLCEVIIMAMLMAWPELSTFLPNSIG